MTDHELPAEEAVEVLGTFTSYGVQWCLGGGWGVDALLGEQTRSHEDLDLWVLAEDAEPLFEAAAELGADRVAHWPGNRPWNFVLHDGGRRRIDLHFYEQASDEELHYGSCLSGHRFPFTALQGRGTIRGTDVRCEAPEWAVRWHTGYPLREVDRHDVPLLCRRFGIQLPDDYR